MPKRREQQRKPQNPNCKNRTIFTGDNLDVLRDMNEACVDLIYLDPPFNSNRNYSAPIGSKAAGAWFKDIWTLDDVDNRWLGEIAKENNALFKVIDAAGEAHGKNTKAYLCAMAIRLIEMRRVLKDTGSIYLHVDPTMSHYLKWIMDVVFGKDCFLNEVIWSYTSGGASRRKFAQKHDTVLVYVRSKQYLFIPQKEKSYLAHKYGFSNVKVHQDDKGYYTLVNMRDVWKIDIVGRNTQERTGYPTQKPVKLLERIILASSNKGDVVLDPFCGCATACIAAERLNRKWIGIDISAQAFPLVKDRMGKELYTIEKISSGRVPTVNHERGFAKKGSKADRVPHQKAYNHPEIKQELFGKQQGYCKACGENFRYEMFQVDHIVPKARGGTDDMDNLQLLCGPCNRTKHAKDDAKMKRESKKEIKARIKEYEERLERL